MPFEPKAPVYCVKTTKIYCRPICKARLARRSNVVFFDKGSEAVAAGYRACKRCRPELVDFVPQANQAIERVRKDLEILPEDEAVPPLGSLAREAGLTKYHFHRRFKKATGFTPREYVAALRQRASTGASVSLTPGAISVAELSNGSPGSPRSRTDDWNDGDMSLLKMDDLFSFDDFAVPAMQCMTETPATIDEDKKSTVSSLPPEVYY